MWKIHKQNILYVLACIAVILVAVSMVLRPRERVLLAQANQIDVLKEEIAREKVLLPIYRNLEKENESFKPPLLPNPEPGVLPRKEANKITTLVTGISEKTGMKLISSVPDINSLSRTGKFLSVSVKLLGQFPDLRRFLTELGGIPYIWHTERIQVRSVPGSREFNLTVWFAVENGGKEEKEAESPKKTI